MSDPVTRVLVVDDDHSVRDLVQTVLDEEGYRVKLAADGASALEAIEVDPPEIMILDIMMPVVDGWTVLRTLRAGGTARTRIIVLTARTNEADWLRAYRLGADHYLTKPFTVSELLDAIEMVRDATGEELQEKRDRELEKAKLLSSLESVFDEAP